MKTIIFICLMSVFTSTVYAYPVITLQNPFVGSGVYTTNNNDKKTAILRLHGSEGGSEYYGNIEASTIATLGYTVMTYCYFDCNRAFYEPSQTLKNVEIAKVFAAINWLRSLPTSNGKVIVYGVSRGAELALIIGSLSKQFNVTVDGVIAHTPSDTYNLPFNWSWKNPLCWLCTLGEGKCSYEPPYTGIKWNPLCGDDDIHLFNEPNSAWLLNGTPVLANTRIEIEKYEGPILITVGENDEIWPVEQTHRIEQTLKKAGRTPSIHYFPNEGHAFTPANELKRKDLVLDFLNTVR
jgi:dienelactone hydrolase